MSFGAQSLIFAFHGTNLGLEKYINCNVKKVQLLSHTPQMGRVQAINLDGQLLIIS
jgi:hypothetical protein